MTPVDIDLVLSRHLASEIELHFAQRAKRSVFVVI